MGELIKARLAISAGSSMLSADEIWAHKAEREAWEKKAAEQAEEERRAGVRKMEAEERAAAERRRRAEMEAERRAREERRRTREICLSVYRATADRKVSDLTIREEQQVRLCQSLGMYPPLVP